MFPASVPVAMVMPASSSVFRFFKRDVVGLLDAIEDGLRIRHRGLDPIGDFVGRQFRDVERRDHFRVAPRFFFRGELELVREGAAVALEDDEGGREDGSLLLEEFHESVIDRFVGHAVDQKIGAFFDGGARGFQLGGVNGHAQLQPVRFRDDGVNDRPEDRGPFDVGLARRG